MQIESSSESTIVDFAIRPRRLLWSVFLVCLTAEVLFFLLDWHVNYARMIDAAPIRNMLNTTREDGVASWFGVTQTAFVALTLWLIYLTVRRAAESRLVALGWLVLALFFSYMAFDDGAEFHERVGSTFKIMQYSAAENSGGVLDIFPSYPWQILFLPIFSIAGLFMLVFLWRQLRLRSLRLLVLAGISCFVVAVGLDFVEGLDEDHDLNVNMMIAEIPGVEHYTLVRFHREGYVAVRHFQKSFEETLEMFGMTLFLLVFLRHWMQMASEFRLKIVPRE